MSRPAIQVIGTMLAPQGAGQVLAVPCTACGAAFVRWLDSSRWTCSYPGCAGLPDYDQIPATPKGAAR